MHLSGAQLKVVTDILISTGEVLLAALVVPFFVGTFSGSILIVGVLFTGGVWLMAVIINRTNSLS